jgi:hypothetical protein
LAEITASTKFVGGGHGPSSWINDTTLSLSSCCWVCANIKNTTAAVRAHRAASERPNQPLPTYRKNHTHFVYALFALHSCNELPTSSWLW